MVNHFFLFFDIPDNKKLYHKLEIFTSYCFITYFLYKKASGKLRPEALFFKRLCVY